MTQVDGLAAFQRRWGAVPELVRQAARESLEQNATELVTLMRRVVRRRMGDVADSIAWTWGDAPAGTMTIGSLEGGKSYGTLRITVYAGGGDAFHARFLEFGTSKMPAYPFFFPVFRSLKRRMRSRLTRNINKAIRSA